MALLTADGVLADSFEHARDLLANSNTLTGTIFNASVSESKQRIYFLETLADEDAELNDPETPEAAPEYEPRPFAIVMPNTVYTRRRFGAGEWAGSGSFFFIIETPVPAAYVIEPSVDTSDVIREKFRNRKQWGLNMAGKILEELEANSGGNDGSGNPYLNATNIELIEPPGDPQEGEAGDYMGWVYNAEWN